MNTEALHLNLPSPWTQVQTDWSKASGINLYVKRDDLIHPIISGNKWRKLSGILTENEGFNGLLTYGGAYSNHLIATAKAAQLLDVPAIGLIRGEEPKRKSTVLDLCSSYGMELRFLSREEYKDSKRKEGVHEGLLYIPEGGSCFEGTLGCRSIITEPSPDIDCYVVACGTGTSLAGMAQELHSQGSSAQLVGVPVLKNGGFIRDEVNTLNGRDNFTLWTDYHFGGYAKTNPELIQFIIDFQRQTNILLDPIYTGKAAFAIKKQLEEGMIGGVNVGLIHTGGLTGWYGKWTEI